MIDDIHKRLFQHTVPKNQLITPIKGYLRDRWSQIPSWQIAGVHVCPDCGLPTVRIVYQQSEAYTAICMSCGRAHRFHATSAVEAKEIFNRYSGSRIYDMILHCVGLDLGHAKPYRNYYDAGLDDQKVWNEHVGDLIEGEDNWYRLTREGLLFLGYDISEDDWLSDEINRAKKIIW